MKRVSIAASLIAFVVTSTSTGGQVTVTDHIPGSKCMSLNLTHDQMLDRSISISIRQAPSAVAPEIGTAGATVIARDPSVPRNGFVEVMMPDGRVGWLEVRWLRPWQPVAGLASRCRPAQMSNGRLGFDYR